MDHIAHWILEYGYAGLFVLLMLGIVGVPLPDETLLTFAGYLIYRGKMHAMPALATAFLGSACGITLSFVLGSVLGAWLIERYGGYVHLTPERIQKADGWFQRYGRWTLTFGYFIPGVRHVTAYAAGMTRMRYEVFALFAYSGALFWASTFLALGWFLGPQWHRALRYVARGHVVVLCVLAGVLCAAGIFWALRPLRRRRRGV
jgi:membrane protein DedA with SNARE-associated domain